MTVAVESDRPALLVLHDSNYPGWQATVDGAPAPILTTNVLFRGVFVPPGAHTVAFHFAPATWVNGLRISLAALALLLLVIALGTTWLLSSRSAP
ncbi:MAG: YfhO family protein [Caldilineaceae bacterium]|nr:YfhO family protein [Caldilineaceae bacterium]